MGLLDDQNLKNIHSKMIDYLADGDMAEKRLVDRIVRLRLRYLDSKRYIGYTAENAKLVIPLLREEGYVNEERYAHNLFENLKDKKDGLRSIKRKMLHRQIKPEIVTAIMEEFEESGRTLDLTKIRALAKAKLARLNEKYGSDRVKKYQIRGKMYAWLSTRGYGPAEIAEILKADNLLEIEE